MLEGKEEDSKAEHLTVSHSKYSLQALLIKNGPSWKVSKGQTIALFVFGVSDEKKLSNIDTTNPIL